MTGTTLGRNSIATALLSPSLVCASLSLKLILGSPKKVVNGFDVEVMRKPDWILCAKIPSHFPFGHDNHGIKSMHDFTFSLYSALTGN